MDEMDRDGCVNLRLKDDADATDILRKITEQTPVRGIQIVRPTLDEIFIEQVARNRGTEAASAAREELTHA